MKLDIYDFDKTVIPFDSGSKFTLFCYFRYPWIIVFFPYMFYGLLRYGVIDRNLTKMKGYVFRYVSAIPVEKAVNAFWNRHEKQIFEWAKKENRPNYTVCISASPDFLIEEIAGRMGFDKLICTKHDSKGRTIGTNCRAEEKVRRFREEYPDAEVINVCSDSLVHDKYIFSLGQHCFHVESDGTRTEFNYSEMYKTEW